MLQTYENSMKALNQELSALGLSIEAAIDKTWKVLETFDVELADEVYNGDTEIDEKVRECMRMDLTISMTQSPVAADWRDLMATLKILSDLERIADHCADICRYVHLLADTGHPIAPPPGLREMYGVMSSMVSDVLDFYKGKDCSQAELMKDKDDVVDVAFTHLMEEISEQMNKDSQNSKQHLMEEISEQMNKDSQNSKQYVTYVLIVKYIERMADHANNIANWVIYREKNEINI